jgi:hypothetical protein
MDGEQGTGSRSCEMGGGKQGTENKDHGTQNWELWEQGAENRELGTGNKEQQRTVNIEKSLRLVYRVVQECHACVNSIVFVFRH